MKIVFMIGALLLSSTAFAQSKVDLCHEPIKVLEKQLAEYPGESRPEAEQILQSSMQRIQQYCQQKYGNQQQQQLPNELSRDQVFETEFRTLLLCEGQRNWEVKKLIDRGECLLPTGELYQQPQDGSGCSYRAVYLRNSESIILSSSRYVCD